MIMDGKVFILSGVSGSGKSYIAKAVEAGGVGARIHSTDAKFIQPDGSYVMQPELLGLHHSTTLREYAEDVRNPEVSIIVVDNTNTTLAEVAPYAALAQAFGRAMEIVTLVCDPVVAWQRNTHATPLKAVWQQHLRLMQRDLPPWWPHHVQAAQHDGEPIDLLAREERIKLLASEGLI
jgi:predicted kinase